MTRRVKRDSFIRCGYERGVGCFLTESGAFLAKCCALGYGHDAHSPVHIDPTTSRDDDRVFDRQWALTLIARALEIAAGELRDAGKAAHFDALKPWLTGENAVLSQADAARQLGVSEGAVKVAIHRLRLRFREAVKAGIAQTVPEAADVDDELRHLLAVRVAQ